MKKILNLVVVLSLLGLLHCQRRTEGESVAESKSETTPQSAVVDELIIAQPVMEEAMTVAGAPLKRSVVYEMRQVMDADVSYERPAEQAVYNRIEVANYKDVLDEPLSTFSIDVDTASYANIRSILQRGGSLPPVDAVRIEEMINYFDYQYPQPQGQPFAIHHEIGACPWNPAAQLVLVGLQGQVIESRQMPPANLVFLIDVSGSMNSSDKLGLLKHGFLALIDQLRPQDRVSIVTYAGSDRIVAEGISGNRKQELRRAIDALTAGGGTAGARGVSTAYELAHRNWMEAGNNRIILATDGDFNIGISSESALLRMIEEERGQGVFLSVLGFGRSGYMDGKMEQLANHGDGNFNYIDSRAEARKVLVEDMAGTLLTIAKDVKIQVEFNPNKVARYRLIGYENRALNNEDFADDRKDAGELGAGHQVTALYEVIMSQDVAVLPEKPLKYQERVIVADADEWMTVSLRYKLPQEEQSQLVTHVVTETKRNQANANLTLAATVAEFGLFLRQDPHAQIRDLTMLVRDLDPFVSHADVAQLQQLIDQANQMQNFCGTQYVRDE